jgi:hypothetical protein
MLPAVRTPRISRSLRRSQGFPTLASLHIRRAEVEQPSAAPSRTPSLSSATVFGAASALVALLAAARLARIWRSRSPEASRIQPTPSQASFLSRNDAPPSSSISHPPHRAQPSAPASPSPSRPRLQKRSAQWRRWKQFWRETSRGSSFEQAAYDSTMLPTSLNTTAEARAGRALPSNSSQLQKISPHNASRSDAAIHRDFPNNAVSSNGMLDSESESAPAELRDSESGNAG